MKRRAAYIAFLSFALLLCSLFTYAQDVKVSATIDSTNILIGDPAHIHLKATFDAKSGAIPKIQWPALADTLMSKVHVISKTKITTSIPDSNHPTLQTQSQDITITSFDSGYYAIPPFTFIVNGDTSRPAMTEPLMLQVRTVPVDTTKAFRDIKGPIQVKYPVILILMWIGIGLVALGIIIFLIYYFSKRSRKVEVAPVEVKAPPVEPHIKALKALEELALQKLWQEGKVKEYYSGISEILRVYLDERFRIDAPEMTTDEIMYALRRADIMNELKDKLRDILVLADLVKFAKEQPTVIEHEAVFNSALDFVHMSARKPEPVITPQPAQQPPTTNPPATL